MVISCFLCFTTCGLGPYFSKCGPLSRNISLLEIEIRNPQNLLRQKLEGMGPSSLSLTHLPGDSDACSSLRTIGAVVNFFFFFSIPLTFQSDL